MQSTLRRVRVVVNAQSIYFLIEVQSVRGITDLTSIYADQHDDEDGYKQDRMRYWCWHIELGGLFLGYRKSFQVKLCNRKFRRP